MDLQSLINSKPSNGLLELLPGEFFGQVVIDRPITIIGKGKSTWIGSKQSPTIRITCPGVTLRNLMIENTAGPDGVAVEAVDESNPVLEDVEVRGLIVGMTKVSFLPPPPLDLGGSSEELPSSRESSPSPQPTTAPQPQPSPPHSSRFAWFVAAAVLVVSLLGVLFFLYSSDSEMTKRQEIERLRQEKEQALARLQENERQRLETERKQQERLEQERTEKEQALARIKEVERQRAESERQEKERAEKERREKDLALAKLREMESEKSEAERRERKQRDKEREDNQKRAKEEEDVVARIKQLSVDYYDAMISGHKQKLLFLYSFPMPQYFSKTNASRSAVEDDMDSYFSRWSRRSGNLQSVTVLSGSSTSGGFLVRLVYDYTFVTTSGNTRRGRSITDLWWRDSLTEGWKIKSASETVARYE